MILWSSGDLRKKKEQRLKAIAARPATAAFFFRGSPLDRHATTKLLPLFFFFLVAGRRSTGTRRQNHCPFAFFFRDRKSSRLPRGDP